MTATPQDSLPTELEIEALIGRLRFRSYKTAFKFDKMSEGGILKLVEDTKALVTRLPNRVVGKPIKYEQMLKNEVGDLLSHYKTRIFDHLNQNPAIDGVICGDVKRGEESQSIYEIVRSYQVLKFLFADFM